MDDLDMLGRDFGFGPRGKSNPMRSGQADRRRNNDPSFSDVFGGPAKYTPSSNSVNDNKNSTMSDFDYDSIFNSSKSASETNKSKDSSSKASSFPVYDKPVYDEDIFDGLPGMKSQPASSTVSGNGKVRENMRSTSAKSSSNSKGFDDLLAEFGSGNSAASNRVLLKWEVSVLESCSLKAW
ncbi:UNVERIFIED_CONTAM: hypothetical protein Slati_0526900 [Sesamum latifolium]|uniref:Auxilin-related protein 1 n=1 Tax=Sesamum latifolium TaxID=2727402 RepID=A0AAW2XXV5_9LAMI